jgi:hypothetical protein
MGKISALVTRWRSLGSTGRVGPYLCEVVVEQARGKLVLRFVRNDGKRVAILLEPIDGVKLIAAVSNELVKYAKT